MISISAYNRYHAPTGRYVRVETEPAARHKPPPRPGPFPRPEPPPPTPPPPPPRPRPGPEFSLKRSLLSFLPNGMDGGDLMLLAVLFFLYMESKDEDFLVIFLVVGYSMLKKDVPDRKVTG